LEPEGEAFSLPISQLGLSLAARRAWFRSFVSLRVRLSGICDPHPGVTSSKSQRSSARGMSNGMVNLKPDHSGRLKSGGMESSHLAVRG
jgi:hypothetical protein